LIPCTAGSNPAAPAILATHTQHSEAFVNNPSQDALSNVSILSGNSNPELSKRIARTMNVPLGKAQVARFSDGEINVEILENIRGRDVYIVQSTCPPVNDNLMEMLIMADACRRASAASITAVIPYFGYARQDRRPRAARVPISAQLVASMIGASGINRVLTIDLHSDQIQGFFPVPVDNVYASPVLLGDAWKQDRSDLMVVSPDIGGVVRARALAKRLDDADLAIIDKRRPQANESHIVNIIGDVEGKNCIMIDDMVDTAGTLCKAADYVKSQGARSVRAYITHPVLSGPAIERINESQLDEMVVTDTIPLTAEGAESPKIRQLGVAELLGETMRRIALNESVSSLYLD
jgi:ribose-phosphate pyrophosphokinase